MDWLFEPGSSGGMKPIDQRRVMEKMDDYMSRRDYAGAERHLKYWLEEARMGRDERGELMVLNELVGHYRKTGQRDEAISSGEAALRLVDELDFGGTLSEGTTCVNVATALNAFGENERAMALFERARAVYEAGGAEPKLLGGLYNNMALTCAAMKRWDEAVALYDRAMEEMGKAPYGALEQAITCLNVANLLEARDGMEAAEGRVYDLLDRAAALLDGPGYPRDGYYAFVCEKCAPTFEYYGYFAEAERLKGVSKGIYGGGT